MQGHLSEFDLAEVLQVVGLGRQYTGVEVQRDDGRAATIFVKSGIVVSVHAPPNDGKQAFFEMFRENAGRFFVFRTETPASLPEPLGPMSRLLMEAASSSAPSRRPSAPSITVSSDPPARESSMLPFADIEATTNAAIARPARLPREHEALTLDSIAPKVAPGLSPNAVVDPELGVNLGARHVSVKPNAVPAIKAVSSAPKAPPVAASNDNDTPRIIAIASPKGGCGKTTVALNAAIALARQGHAVTLVDADVNGDILSAIDSRSRALVGTYDVVEGRASPSEGLLRTVLPQLRILPAVGKQLPRPETLTTDLSEPFRKLLRKLAADSIVIVDTPAGMFGVTRNVLSASTHVVAVLQAEVVAHRSFERFREAVGSIPEAERPRVLGVVLNMLQMRQGASLSVLQSVCLELPPDWLFETSIPRHPAILDATARGVPIRNMDESAPPAVAFLFDTLAAEVAQRLRLSAVEARPMQLLL